MFKKKVKPEKVDEPKVTVLPKKDEKSDVNPWIYPTVESMENETKAAGKTIVQFWKDCRLID